MKRFLIRVTALAIILGGVYAIKNFRDTDTNTTETAVAVEKNIEKETSITEKAEAEKSNNTTDEKKLVLKPVETTATKLVLAPVKNSAKQPTSVAATKIVPAKLVQKTVIAPKKIEKNWPTTKVKVFMYDFEIDMSSKTFPAGIVEFEVQNSGLFAHQFAIAGVKNFGLVGRNETKTFVAQLTKSGEYKILSEKEMDIEREMYETVVVE